MPNGKVYMVVPFAVMTIIAAALTLLFLPETMGTPLSETIEQVEGEEQYVPQEMQPLRTKETDETEPPEPPSEEP
ncbi:hypothetical protein Y032_0150g2773 [Ancylostoma ceylanicum]|nr:hypothetical protein Y032_0150g2773 [Ancylostoma ceylanicum]